MTNGDEQSYKEAYIACALWSSGGDGHESFEGMPVAQEAVDSMVADCVSFMSANCALLDKAMECVGYDASRAGHDYLLSRNGHGTGYWDRDLPDGIGDRLTEAARKEGQMDLYLGDDGKVWCFPLANCEKTPHAD